MNYKYNLKDQKFNHLGQNLLLHPYKSIFWKETKILFISDLHIGKATHFRKAGIPIPEGVHSDDFERIDYLLKYYEPERLIILGDVFHSVYNSAWEEFRIFFEKAGPIKPELIAGNHDILDADHYSFMDVYPSELIIEPFILSHKPMTDTEIYKYYNLCGHLHPSIRIRGSARQSFRVECFYFRKKHGILPAFGNFTGSSKLPNKQVGDQIFAITENNVIQIH